MGFGRCCFMHIAQPQSMQNKCYMIVLGTPALFIFITSGIEFVPENSPIIKFDPNPVSNGQLPTPESIRGMGTGFRRNDFWDQLWGGGGGGGSGAEASVNYDWLMVALNTIVQS